MVAIPVARLTVTRGMMPLMLTLPLVIGYIWLCWAKTDGDWKWRWGPGDDR